jgi:hypothetical protein
VYARTERRYEKKKRKVDNYDFMIMRMIFNDQAPLCNFFPFLFPFCFISFWVYLLLFLGGRRRREEDGVFGILYETPV